ncbi:MAG: hypothetical protein QME78_09250 [Thermodesulfobacteriota bacterium]|nr:hypothetical protein [Thermodesulfobacteriota bacterium]
MDFLVIPDLFENVLQGGGLGKTLHLGKKILVFSFHFFMLLQQLPDFFSFFCSRDLFVLEDLQGGPAQIGMFSGIVLDGSKQILYGCIRGLTGRFFGQINHLFLDFNELIHHCRKSFDVFFVLHINTPLS